MQKDGKKSASNAKAIVLNQFLLAMHKFDASFAQKRWQFVGKGNYTYERILPLIEEYLQGPTNCGGVGIEKTHKLEL